MAPSNQPIERFDHRRVPVLLPVELLVFDTDGVTLSPEPVQGMVLNASVSGVHMTFVGPTVRIFSVHDWRLDKVKLRFLVGKLATAKPMDATIRWSSKVDMGWGLGVQWEHASDTDAEHLLEQLVAYSSYRPEYDKPRRPLAWAAGASLVLGALLAMHFYDQQISSDQVAEVQERAEREGRNQLEIASKACNVRVDELRASIVVPKNDITAAAFQAAEAAHAAKVAAAAKNVVPITADVTRTQPAEEHPDAGAPSAEVAAHE